MSQFYSPFRQTNSPFRDQFWRVGGRLWDCLESRTVSGFGRVRAGSLHGKLRANPAETLGRRASVGFVTWFCARITSVTAHPFIGAEVEAAKRVYRTKTGLFGRKPPKLAAKRGEDTPKLTVDLVS